MSEVKRVAFAMCRVCGRVAPRLDELSGMNANDQERRRVAGQLGHISKDQRLSELSAASEFVHTGILLLRLREGSG